MKHRVILSVCVLLLCAGMEARSGVLYARRPGTETPVYSLYMSKIRTQVRIEDQLAVTHVDEEFFNDNGITLEGFYAFQLPAGAKVSGLWLWVDGKRLRFIVKKLEDAHRMYDSVVIGVRRDPAILESLGKNRFQLKIFPIPPNSSRRVEIRYFHTLPLTPDGYVHYSYPLNTLDYQSTPVDVTEMTIQLHTRRRILDLETAFDDKPLLNRVIRNSDSAYTITFGLEKQNYTCDYTLRYRPEKIFDDFSALSWTDPTDPGSDPYFMAWHNVADTAREGEERDIVVVLDGSGSMSGDRIESVKVAVKNLLWKLGPEDCFRIVLFGSNAISEPVDKSLHKAETGNIEQAIRFIDRYYEASGGTNYGAAFQSALDADFRPASDKRLLFLTDGEPTVGVTGLHDLLSLISSVDRFGIRIYPVIFFSPRIDLLYDIAQARGGVVTTVDVGDNIETIISRILLQLELGGLRNPRVTWLQGKTRMVYPKEFPEVVSSSELITSGRYSGDGMESARLEYSTFAGTPQTVIRDVDFDPSATDLREVGAYWAAERIDELLEQIDRYGKIPELVSSIIDLSIKHQVLSPYTAFLVLETNVIDPPTTTTDDHAVYPAKFTLHPLYPNPLRLFSGAGAVIRFDLGEASSVRITVTDILGRTVRVLSDGALEPGSHQILWDGRDDPGNPVRPGTYFIRLTVGSQTVSAKACITG